MAVYGEYGDLVELFLVFDECGDDDACDFVVRDPAEKEAPGAGAVWHEEVIESPLSSSSLSSEEPEPAGADVDDGDDDDGGGGGDGARDSHTCKFSSSSNYTTRGQL